MSQCFGGGYGIRFLLEVSFGLGAETVIGTKKPASVITFGIVSFANNGVGGFIYVGEVAVAYPLLII